MSNKTDSVAKGGSAVAIARVTGMVFSFLLFVLLSRQSPEHAGTFKTVLTYIVIAEFLSMLGLHRWLAAEISTLKEKRWAIFWATNVFTFFVSLLLMAIYVAIANTEIYDDSIKRGLILGALAVIPSGVSACTMSALIGIGQSQLLGRLNLIENLCRCSIAIGLVYLNSPVSYVIGVFVVTRWLIAAYGFLKLKTALDGHSWEVDQALIKKIKQAAPKFALIIAAFLLLRNAGLLMIPAITGLTEAATFAIAYQLFDLILIVPSVLAMTSINLFSNKAVASKASLNRVASQLALIMAISLFPLIAITCFLAPQFIRFLYGDQYTNGANILVFLMLAAGLMMIDMVLSQIMQARKDYDNDMLSVTVAGICAGILTYLLTQQQGALGASIALAIAILINIGMRLFLLKDVFTLPLLMMSIWKPTLASIAIYVLGYCLLTLPVFEQIRASNWLWLACIPAALIIYGLVAGSLGCLKRSHRNRIKHFLFQH